MLPTAATAIAAGRISPRPMLTEGQSYCKQVGDRMLNSPDYEHGCFSDNTHSSPYYAGMGVQYVYLGEFVRVAGRLVSGPSLSGRVARTDVDLAADTQVKLSTALTALGRTQNTADTNSARDFSYFGCHCPD
jgi:putative iron-regulated protein